MSIANSYMCTRIIPKATTQKNSITSISNNDNANMDNVRVYDKKLQKSLAVAINFKSTELSMLEARYERGTNFVNTTVSGGISYKSTSKNEGVDIRIVIKKVRQEFDALLKAVNRMSNVKIKENKLIVDDVEIVVGRPNPPF